MNPLEVFHVLMFPQVAVELVYPDALLPTQATEGAACFDLHAYDPALKSGQQIAMLPGETRLIGTGIRIAIPEGYEGQIRPRSGLAAKFQIGILNSPATVDSDYRGEWKIILHRYRYTNLLDPNMAGEPFYIAQRDRIAQVKIALCPRPSFYVVKKLDSTLRGEGGFGHTGKSATPLEGAETFPPTPEKDEAKKEKTDSEMFPPELRPVFRALSTDQRQQLLRSKAPIMLLTQVYELQDRSEWDIPENATRAVPITYSTAFDLLTREDEHESA